MDKILTLQDVTEYLGQPQRKESDEYLFQCPICQDEHKDNLKFNEKKGVLYCFANDEHSKIVLSEIGKRKAAKEKNLLNQNDKIPNYIKNKEMFFLKQEICNLMLLGDVENFNLYFESGKVAKTIFYFESIKDEKTNFYSEEQKRIKLEQSMKKSEKMLDIIKSDKPQRARTYLKEKRGINTSTIEKTGLGIDFDGYGKWVIPIYNVEAQLVGFEYRGSNFDHKRVWKEKETPSCLSLVYGKHKNKYCWLVEGFLDAYVMIQILEKSNILDKSTIYTCSNGAKTTLKVIQQLDFNAFEKYYLSLDNDIIKAKELKNGQPQNISNQTTEEIIKKYPFFEDHTIKFTQEELEKGNKDITDYWFLHFNT